MGEQVAVVGGTGFLGANVVAELLNAGYTPVIVARGMRLRFGAPVR